MTQGQCFIISSEFHNVDIGLVYLGETKDDYIFAPLIFKNNKFDNKPTTIFDGKIQTNTILSGLHGDTRTGIFAVYESKKKPSFLTDYCKRNSPFITLNIDEENIVLGQNSKNLRQIIIGGMTTFLGTKELFDKFDIQGLLSSDFDLSDLKLILKNAA